MKQALQREIPLVVALLVLGVLTTGTGVYFMASRPPLLPEDLRFTGVALAQVSEAELRWLSIVFRTWGGFTVGLGLRVGRLLLDRSRAVAEARHCRRSADGVRLVSREQHPASLGPPGLHRTDLRLRAGDGAVTAPRRAPGAWTARRRRVTVHFGAPDSNHVFTIAMSVAASGASGVHALRGDARLSSPTGPPAVLL